MPNVTRDQSVQLGCGTLILIAIIVMIFSRTDTKDVEREIRGLRSEVGKINKLIEDQSAEIRQLRERLSPPSPKVSAREGQIVAPDQSPQHTPATA